MKKRISLVYKPEPPQPPPKLKPLFRVWRESRQRYALYPADTYKYLLESGIVNSCTIERATGLVDSGGWDIYENDICAGIYMYNYCEGSILEEVIGTIRYNIQHSRFVVGNVIGGDLSSPGFELADMHNITVIGNIHENPELMERCS